VFLRILYKSVYQHYIYGKKRGRRVLIYGAHEVGLLTYHALTNDSDRSIRIIGFIDHDKQKVGNRVSGIRVYDADRVNEKFVKHRQIDEIIISYPSLASKGMHQIIDRLAQLPVE